MTTASKCAEGFMPRVHIHFRLNIPCNVEYHTAEIATTALAQSMLVAVEVCYKPNDFAVASQQSSPASALIPLSKLIAAIAPLAKRIRAAPSPIISAARRSTSGLWPTQQVLASFAENFRDHSNNGSSSEPGSSAPSSSIAACLLCLAMISAVCRQRV